MIRRHYLLLFAILLSFVCEAKKIGIDEMDLSTMEIPWGANKVGKNTSGNPLTIGGIVFQKGIGTRAISKYIILLDGKAVNFSAKVGIDDGTKGNGGAKFYILGDKKILWESKVMHKGESAVNVNIPIEKITKLAMYVSDEGGNLYADWIEPSITYNGNAPVPLAFKIDASYILTPPVALSPRINGPRVIGATPGRPFLFRIPVTGKAPITVTLKNLPAGLDWNPTSRVISGSAPAKGEYVIKITAKNESGSAKSDFKIITGKELVLTPPLGWNSWNCWGMSVDQEKVKASADAMVSSGMADHGWTYINIDDGWEAPERKADGEIQASKKFPDMKGLGDYIHSYGLKFGIYSSPGPKTCGGLPASYQHELQDVMTWTKWGYRLSEI